MSAKATVYAPANIAFVKYWGARDLEQAIPCNRSISMTLDRCRTRTTVEHVPDGREHDVQWKTARGGLEPAPPAFAERVHAHLERIRAHAGVGGSFRVATENSFPSAAGLASSASGFAALSLATARCLGLEPDGRELSVLARRSGSGSAARSAFGGYVEWPADFAETSCHAVPLARDVDWPLCDVVAIVHSGAKPSSSLEGHRRAQSSPYFELRQERLERRLVIVREAIEKRDLELMGPTIEEEAIDLHLIAMSSSPPVFYWRPATLAVLEAVRELRSEGVSAYATMDAGPNVHVICTPDSERRVGQCLEALAGVETVIHDRVGSGPRPVDDHLF